MSKKFKSVRGLSSTVLDIVIPVYNRFDLLEKCLAALPEAVGDSPYRVYIVDNGSDVEKAKAFYATTASEHQVFLNRANKGFPQAVNRGARSGYSPYILLLNSDCIMTPGSIAAMLETIRSSDSTGVVGAKLLFPFDVGQLRPDIRPAGKVQHVGMFVNIRADFIHVFSGWSSDNQRVNSVGEVHAVTGACMLIRRSVWARVGGMFEGYGLGTYEDVDFCMSVHELGYNILVNPNAVGYHYTSASAESQLVPFPLSKNKQIFLGRWQEKLMYSEWAAW